MSNPLYAATQIQGTASQAESEAVKKMLTYVSVGLLGMMLYREWKDATREKTWRDRVQDGRAQDGRYR